LPLIAKAVAEVAHPAIRNRGTFGGSIALADPAAEMPACALALAAVMVVQGPGGERRIAADAFFLGSFETALQPGELLTRIEIPIPPRRCPARVRRDRAPTWRLCHGRTCNDARTQTAHRLVRPLGPAGAGARGRSGS